VAEHDDSVPFREQEVAPPGDGVWRRDAAGVLVFVGTCRMCHAPTTVPLPNVAPGVLSRVWRRRGPGTLVRTMDCQCRRTHPDNEDELPGCGAWWDVELPPGVTP
jgi:hypothetical protein